MQEADPQVHCYVDEPGKKLFSVKSPLKVETESSSSRYRFGPIDSHQYSLEALPHLRFMLAAPHHAS